MDRYVGKVICLDWNVEAIVMWTYDGIVTRPTCSIPDRYVVSPEYSRSLRSLTCNIPDRYVVSPVAFHMKRYRAESKCRFWKR